MQRLNCAAKRLRNMDLAKMVVGAASEQYAKDWEEKAIIMEFDCTQSSQCPKIAFLPQAEAWVFRHAGLEFKLPRQKGQDEFNEMLKMLMGMVGSVMGLFGRRDRFYDEDAETVCKATLTRNGKEITQLLVCQGDDITVGDMVNGVRMLWYMQ